jgi:hypothetical protein
MPKRKATSTKHSSSGRAEPKPGRPHMPRAYQISTTKKFLPWSHVGEQMAKSHNYWIGTTRPDGRPHVMPVWGVWVDEAFYFSTDRGSRKALNLADNPAMAVHLESGNEVVILEGVAEEVAESSRLRSIDDAYFEKYGMRIIGHPGDIVIYGLRPRVVFGWRERDFNKSATRWLFGDH